MGKELKRATIRPLLKNAILELIFKYYRPVSNIPFLGKVSFKVALGQLLYHLDINNLHNHFQSAYHQFHSTETAHLRYKSEVTLAQSCSCVEPSLAFVTGPTSTDQRVT